MIGKTISHYRILEKLGRHATLKFLPEKLLTALRESFLEAFEKTGGMEELVEWAKENRSEFYRMICHLLPRTVENTGGDGGPIVIRIDSNVGESGEERISN